MFETNARNVQITSSFTLISLTEWQQLQIEQQWKTGLAAPGSVSTTLTGVVNVQFIDDAFVSTTEHDHQIFDRNSAVAMPRSRTRSGCVCNPLPFQYGCCHLGILATMAPTTRMFRCPDAKSRMLRYRKSRDVVFVSFSVSNATQCTKMHSHCAQSTL